MNFLAHCALAADAGKIWDVAEDQSRGLLAGAVIADFSKGRINPNWPQPLQAGIRLHRRIDAVSNQNAAIRISCDRYPKTLRRYAPIFVDILADYYLSLNWQDCSQQAIDPFTQHCYSAIALYADYLPEHGHKFAAYMQDSNLLARYHDWLTIERAIESSLRRLNRADLTDAALSSTRMVADHAVDDFHVYYRDFRRQLAGWSNLLDAP
jgi:acyl carrier protein phosphodiesterase